MFHYVFLDPQTIQEAADAGEMGLGRLIELLNGFRRDVILAETDAWRVESELGDMVRAIPFQTERRMLQDILISLKQSGPLLVMEGDDDLEMSLGEFARYQGSKSDLDLILSPGTLEDPPDETWIKASLTNLHGSDFANRRMRLANGRTFPQGNSTFGQIARACFSKLVRHADTVRVFDYALGKYYGNDQPINLKRLVRFMRDHATRLKVLHLCTLSAARRSLERDIADLQNEVDFEIKLELKESESELPHPRYLGADRRYLDIDRGIDLCDAHDKCRLTQIKYAASPE